MKKLYILTLLSLFICISINSCNSINAKSNQFSWMTDIEQDYPSETYIAQIGEGTTQEDAENDAVGRIARYFESNIDVSSISKVSMAETNTEVKIDSSIDTQTFVSSNVKLIAVQYATPFYNKKEKRYYTVAFIDRDEAFQLIKPKIEKPAISIMSFFDKANSEDDKLLKCSYLKQAKKSEEEFLTQYFFLKLLNSRKAENYVEIANRLASIDADIASLIQESKISIIINNDLNSTIQVATKEGLSSLGYQVKNSGGEYTLKINIILDNQSTQMVSIFYPGIEITLLNKEKVISSTSKSLPKVSAMSKDVAIKRSYQKIESIIKDELLNDLL